MDLEEYYSADERRRQSAELELGTRWTDTEGRRYELSWIEDTGELYAMLEPVPGAASWTPFGDVEVEAVSAEALVVLPVAVIPERATLDRLLDGWADHMEGPDSVAWVADRLRQGGLLPGGPA